MAKKLGIFKCEICGNIVEVVSEGGGQLTCCGQLMGFMEEKTADKTVEKHVPFIEKTTDGYKVRIGENAAHPMTEEHYIQWIELIIDDLVLRQELKPGDKAEAEFKSTHSDNVIAREYCNIHGHWKN